MQDRIQTLLTLLEEDPRDAFALYALATEYARAGQEAAARNYYHRLMDFHPGYLAGYYHLGKLEEHTGNLMEARDLYLRGLDHARSAGDHHAASELHAALMHLDDRLNG
jgi:tetratricopeptide (TPR) repeat protein